MTSGFESPMQPLFGSPRNWPIRYRIPSWDSYVSRMYPCVLVSYTYVTPMYPYVSYVTRMYPYVSYVTRMLLVVLLYPPCATTLVSAHLS